MLIKLTNGDSVTIQLNHIDEPHAIVVSNHDGELHHREFHNPNKLVFPTLEEFYSNKLQKDDDIKVFYYVIKQWLEDNNVI